MPRAGHGHGGRTTSESGIALHGNGLRIVDALGLLDSCVARGYAFSTVAIRAADFRATVLAELEIFRTGGPEIPAALGMYRPDLARILMSAADAAGASTRFATTVGATKQDEHGVEVEFSDGSHGRYDVMIGADGARSWTRRMMGRVAGPRAHRAGGLADLHIASGRGDPRRAVLRGSVLHRGLHARL
jgi:2-polyprenyl-6-methoxyphenol hydroxylase-like FAD-dependent oxidoreductase